MDFSKVLQNLVIQTPPPPKTQETPSQISQQVDKSSVDYNLMNEIGLAVKRR